MKLPVGLLAAFAVFGFLGPVCAQDGEPRYVENEWNYVDQSMDVSHGIPEEAYGRLALIRETGKLRVATEPYFVPAEFIDPGKTGHYQTSTGFHRGQGADCRDGGFGIASESEYDRTSRQQEDRRILLQEVTLRAWRRT